MTEPRPQGRHVIALLFLLCVALACGLYAEATQPLDRTAPGASASRETAEQPPDPDFVMPPLNTYAEVVARPLFTSTRRPPVDVTPGRPADFQLVGTIISTRDSQALLSHGVPPKIDRVALGQKIEGWTVQSIEPDRVVLVQGGSRAEIGTSAKPPEEPKQVRYRPGTEPILNGGD
jgi:hypothetical protein